jgi:putative restriction endonuclease
MRFWIGVTDKSWYEYLRPRSPEEANFWQPSSRPLAAFLQPGVPFLFKLHSPHDFIVGGGFFVRFSALPARLAWEAFQGNNGVPDYASLKSRVEQYRGGPVKGDPEIGCNILNAPFFFEEKDWIEVPGDWAKNIVRGKTYDTEQTEGLRLWNRVEGCLRSLPDLVLQAEAAKRYGAEYLVQARLGQGTFRVLVTDAYHRRCAITAERTLPVLEAAHIRPYAQHGPHLTSNGLLLRADVHTLFDQGYITVTEDHRVEISRRIKEEFENGKEYYKHHGQGLLVVPDLKEDAPAREFLRWHSENIYLG